MNAYQNFMTDFKKCIKQKCNIRTWAWNAAGDADACFDPIAMKLVTGSPGPFERVLPTHSKGFRIKSFPFLRTTYIQLLDCIKIRGTSTGHCLCVVMYCTS